MTPEQLQQPSTVGIKPQKLHWKLLNTSHELTEFYNNRGNPNAGNCFKKENMVIFAYHAR